MPVPKLQAALASLEHYWSCVLHLPGVPNVEARNLGNYSVVDTYVALKKVLESKVMIYD